MHTTHSPHTHDTRQKTKNIARGGAKQQGPDSPHPDTRQMAATDGSIPAADMAAAAAATTSSSSGGTLGGYGGPTQQEQEQGQQGQQQQQQQQLEYTVLLHDVEAVTRRAQEGAKACKAMGALLHQTAALEEAHGAAIVHVSVVGRGDRARPDRSIDWT